LEANRQVIENQTKDNFENGKEYVGLIETAYQNLMLDKQVLIIEKRLAGHKSFLPQKMVRQDLWTRGLQRRYSSK
jgi:hypothetical protein